MKGKAMPRTQRKTNIKSKRAGRQTVNGNSHLLGIEDSAELSGSDFENGSPKRNTAADLTELMSRLIQARERTRTARGEVCRSNPGVWGKDVELTHKESIQELINARREYNNARMAFATALTSFQNARQQA